jgi:hypothetical protein
LNSGVNDRRARGLLRSMVSMMDILSGAAPLMVDVRQSGSGPGRPPQLGGRVGPWFGVEPTIGVMARVAYESKDHAGHNFWVARSGRYAIRIDATRRGVYPWPITLEGGSVHKGVAPDRDQAAEAVSDALDELPH